jgi:hypothetical protein
MSYAQGSLIEAADYNNIIGTSPGSTANKLNTVWAVGSGSAGYGQTPISSVSASALVTATQWATLINNLNSTLTHQAGSGSGIAAPVAGNQINYLSTLQTQVNNSYTNRLTFASNSAAVTNVDSLSAYAAWTNTSTTSTLTRSFGCRVTFPSADQARYFFNAGGRVKFNLSGVGSGSTRSTAAANMCTYMGGVLIFGANTNGGRAGTGGTVGTNDTTKGYYGATNSNVNIVSVTGVTANYTTDTGTIAFRTNGVQGSNNDNGSQLEFWATINSTSGANAGGSFDDTLSLTVTATVDVSYPETTNLTNSWGTVTVTRL